MVAQTVFAGDQNRSSSDGNANVRYVVRGGSNQQGRLAAVRDP
jgi:hypothetical protein